MQKVLIVDDQLDFCRLAREILEGSGYFRVVGEAHEGVTALELVEKLLPDVVLMDLEMPRINGLEATERIHSRFPDVQTILISVHDEEQCRPLALQAGAVDFISKWAFDIEKVRNALNRRS